MRHATALKNNRFSAHCTLRGVGRIGALLDVARAVLKRFMSRGSRKGLKTMSNEWRDLGRKVSRGITKYDTKRRTMDCRLIMAAAVAVASGY
jgi:hypothetical protein